MNLVDRLKQLKIDNSDFFNVSYVVNKSYEKANEKLDEAIEEVKEYQKEQLKPNLSNIKVEIEHYDDMWQVIKNSALFTIHKKKGKYPDSKWKTQIIRAEHSPIRAGYIVVNLYNIPQFVHGHLVRHHVGITPFIASLRNDRADYEEVPNRNTLQNGRYIFDFQSFINISRKRLCNCASYETRYVWKMVLEELKKYEPELYALCVKECVYRNGLCAEMFSCQYNKTKAFLDELKDYQKLFDGQINENVKVLQR